MADLTCPKCQGPMRSYERSGITVDQCSDCRGVFLDRGELERLVDAEGAYYEKAREPQRERERDHDREREQDRYREHDRDRDYDRDRGRDRDDSPLGSLGSMLGGGRGHGGHGSHGYGKKKKRESFLSELFD